MDGHSTGFIWPRSIWEVDQIITKQLSVCLSSVLLSDVFDEEFRITKTLLVDDELSEDEPGLTVTVSADDRVERNAVVGGARSHSADRLTAGGRAWRPLVRRRSRADERVAEQNAWNIDMEWLSDRRPTVLSICTQHRTTWRTPLTPGTAMYQTGLSHHL